MSSQLPAEIIPSFVGLAVFGFILFLFSGAEIFIFWAAGQPESNKGISLKYRIYRTFGVLCLLLLFIVGTAITTFVRRGLDDPTLAGSWLIPKSILFSIVFLVQSFLPAINLGFIIQKLVYWYMVDHNYNLAMGISRTFAYTFPETSPQTVTGYACFLSVYLMVSSGLDISRFAQN